MNTLLPAVGGISAANVSKDYVAAAFGLCLAVYVNVILICSLF